MKYDSLKLILWDWEGTLCDGTRTRPYAQELIQLFDKFKIKQGVVSNANVSSLTNESMVKQWPFRLVVGYGMNINLKPAPDMINFALKTLKIAPKEAIFLGDTQTDAKASALAGVDFLWGDNLEPIFRKFSLLF